MSPLEVPHQLPPLDEADLVVLSHLRWDWVWQRPQHLISRMARRRRTLFVEEPLAGEVDEPTLRTREEGTVTRLWVEAPAAAGPAGYALDLLNDYVEGIEHWLAGRARDVWLYTPAALSIAERLQPRLMSYDVMDDLTSFADASPELEVLTHRALAAADVVFAGGRSLHRAAASRRGKRPTFLFPSGVEFSHYAKSRALRRPRRRPVAGFVGVIDERFDVDLLDELASSLPEWEIQLVGPTAKIDPATIPRASNIRMLGQQPYERLPEIMAGFDVALMPFALNEATRSISPTKTLEYLAAGLPVVSTRIPDVVADWSEVVHLADTGRGFAQACGIVCEQAVADRDRRLAPLLARYEWDSIASGMTEALAQVLPAQRSAAA
jgi:glycosyltransferase involved in cell wall biosynthesis